MSSRTHALAITATALLAGLMHLHGLLTMPDIAVAKGFQGSIALRPIFGGSETGALSAPGFARFTLALAAFTGLAASALALAIALRTVLEPVRRRLAWALALASWAAAHIFVVQAHPIYTDSFALFPGSLSRVLADAGGYFAGLAAPLLLLRFFIGYPRRPTEIEWHAHFVALREAGLRSLHEGWQSRLYPRSWTRPLLSTQRQVSFTVPILMRFDTAWPLGFAAALAIATALVDAYASGTVRSVLWVLGMIVLMVPMILMFEALRYHKQRALADERRRIDWIYGTVHIGGILLVSVSPLWWLLMAVGLPRFEAWGLIGSAAVVFVGPAMTGLQLLAIAFLAALAMSIFYRGTVDPRLAIRRITLAGAIGFVLAFILLLVERTVAIQLALRMDLPPETGLGIAITVAAATFAPVRSRCERLVNRLVLRYLPLESAVQGRRVEATIVLSDISGYTALSAQDERKALLAAALLQRHAERICESHRGRLVKSMGDAVLLSFDEPRQAIEAVQRLHQAFARGCADLGLPVLQVHSGAYRGAITVTDDGDVYGQVVNIAARLQSQAAKGEVVISRDLAEAADLPAEAIRDLGALTLKNVPEAVSCVALMPLRPASEMIEPLALSVPTTTQPDQFA